uniref:Class I SAM-dependent methyltransferase n=1 Tax=Eiseniibacteriota bacterium TaxID=2212470 RepID=A0A832I2X4_UNCEI
MDILAFNRRAWDAQVERANPWTVPVTPAQVAAARRGEWSVVLTPTRPVPRAWFGALAGRDVLALASGGGQQAPLLAAAGARVTVLDNSPRQLGRDREVAEREGLMLRLEAGDMADLGRFPDGGFDLVFHPVSNLFVPDVRRVWRECFRVLRPGGALLAGFANPVLFMFDEEPPAGADLVARFAIPYADVAQGAERVAALEARGEPLAWGHTLDDQIGGQLEAGFAITGFYEDGFPGHPLDRLIRTFVATRAVRPRG